MSISCAARKRCSIAIESIVLHRQRNPGISHVVSPKTGRLRVERAVAERVHLLTGEELRTWTSREWDAQGPR